MDNSLSLQELMSPKRLDMQARFNNAQIAVDLAYRYAKSLAYVPDVKVPNPDWKEGMSSYEKFTYTESTQEANVANLVKVARALKLEIEKDLNETLKVLEAQDGAKADAAKLS